MSYKDLMGIEAKLAKAVHEGRVARWKQCKLQGVAELLRRLLERRFGPLPPWADQKVANASEEDLVQWGERLLDTNLSLKQLLTKMRY
jgi:hypothetical protein